MSKVTNLSVQSKHKDRCNLYIDDKFFCGLSCETAMKLGLKVGKELSERDLIQAVYESEKSDALTKAISYVSSALKTKKQVKDYLLRKGFDEKIVQETIDKLVEYKFIDDVEYAKRYMETMSPTQGKRMLAYKLMTKGIKKTDIFDTEENSDIQHKDNALKLAEKYMRNKEKNKENHVKLYRYLLNRGFSYEEVDYASSHYKNEEDF